MGVGPVGTTGYYRGYYRVLPGVLPGSTAAGLQEPTRWEWGPWAIQNAAGSDGSDSKMIKPGAFVVRASRSIDTHAHTLEHTQSRVNRACTSFQCGGRLCKFFARVRVPVFVSVCVFQCVRARVQVCLFL